MNNVRLDSTSLCHHLFGGEAETIFDNLKNFKNPKEKREFVDECLKISRVVHLYLLRQSNALPLLDAKSLNDQCHLFSLRSIQITKLYDQLTESQKLERNEINRFFQLVCFLSFPLIMDMNVYVKTFEETMDKMGLKAPLPKRRFIAYLRDEGKCREVAAQKALNRVFESYIKTTLALPQYEDNPVMREINNIAHQNLQMKPNERAQTGTLYTLPKLAGVVFLEDALRQEKIGVVFKVKIVTKDGVAGPIVQATQELQDDDRVLVFEAFAAEDISISKCKQEAKGCPTYFHRSPDIKQRHPLTEKCFYCKKNQTLDLQPYRDRLKTVMQSPKELLYALGADFTVQVQNEAAAPLLEKTREFPLLIDIFQKGVKHAQQNGLNMLRPTTFSPVHVYPDVASHALNEKEFQLDLPPEEFLKSRGIE
jgi:hypothetical protein